MEGYKKITVKMTELEKVYTFCELTKGIAGDIWAERGRWCVDCRSVMGLMAINLSAGATIYYPEEACGSMFERFLYECSIKDKKEN